MVELTHLTAAQLLAGYLTRQFSPVEVVDGVVARIAELDPLLRAFTATDFERALEDASDAEAAYARGGDLPPLLGVPIGVKDLFDTAALTTTYGSSMFADHVPTADAEAVRRVRAAGAIVIGKTRTHEFAWGITTVSEQLGAAHNPWSLDRVAGGSSGGSAVALAAELVPLALGSDTGGSIRIPSNFCGTVGLKPTYGSVSTEGVFALAPSLDHVGPMARTPEDAALLFGALTQPTPMPQLGRIRIGISPDLHAIPLEPEIQEAFDGAVGALSAIGADVVELRVPEAAKAYDAFIPIQRAEAYRVHTQAGLFPARAAEYGPDVRTRLEASASVTLVDYMQATSERECLRTRFAAVFQQVDLLVTPVSSGPPIRIDDHQTDFRHRVMSYTVAQDLTGLPACTVRAGFDAVGVPTAVQLTGPPGSDWQVLAAARALYEAMPEVQARRPELVSSSS